MRCLLVALLAIGCSKRASDPEPVQVPADTALVVTISVAKLRTSPVWRSVEPVIAARVPLGHVKQICGVDPVQSIEALTIALPAGLDSDRAILFARGLSRDTAEGCAKALAASAGQTITIGDEGTLAAYRQGGDAMYAAWLDAKTVAIAPGGLTTKETLEPLFDSTAPRNPLLAKLRGDHTIALVFDAGTQSALRDFIRESGVEPEAGHGWIDLGNTLRAELTLRFASAEQAASVAKQPPAAPFLANVRTTARDREVVFTLQLDEAETTKLVEQLASLATP